MCENPHENSRSSSTTPGLGSMVGILPLPSKTETDRGVTKLMYVMEPDVSGGSGLSYSLLSYTSMLGVAHVTGQVQGGE